MHTVHKDKKITLNKYVLVGVLAAVILIVLGLLYHANRQQQAAINAKVIPSSSPQNNTSGSKTGDTSTKDSSKPPSSTGDKTSGRTSDNTSTPSSSSSTVALTAAPSGRFVSNHKPNLGGSPAPSQEQSTCNTIPGASCYIEFTNDSGFTKKLTAQTADNTGVVIWNWDVKQAGFTEGAWQIIAVASSDGTTKTTTDSLKLEVQP